MLPLLYLYPYCSTSNCQENECIILNYWNSMGKNRQQDVEKYPFFNKYKKCRKKEREIKILNEKTILWQVYFLLNQILISINCHILFLN